MIATKRQHSVVVKGIGPRSRGSSFKSQCCCFLVEQAFRSFSHFSSSAKMGLL